MTTRRGCLVLALALAACDAPYAAFLDAVPVAEPDGAPPVQVYLAIDGLSRAAYDEARAAGAFVGYADGDLVTPFPGTSDYAWTRILRTGSLPGYEIQYFDAGANRLEKPGLSGVLEHPVREGLLDSYACYQRFDFLGDGYFWMKRGYDNPEAALGPTLDEMFWVLARRGRQQSAFLGYLLNIDVLGHKGGQDRAAVALVEIDRRIREFQSRHPGRYHFTLFGDHGNAHREARLIDPREVLRSVGVSPVESLAVAAEALEAVPVVHVRVNYVALHTRPGQIEAVATRASQHPDVDLAVVRLGPHRFALWRRGQRHAFTLTPAGDFLLDDAQRLGEAFGLDLPATLSGAAAFELFRSTDYPDLLERVAGAFTHPAARLPADILLSLPDDVASYGFHVPGSGDGVAIDGFHGGLRRAGSVSVLASESMTPPPMVRADDLLDLFPAMRP